LKYFFPEKGKYFAVRTGLQPKKPPLGKPQHILNIRASRQLKLDIKTEQWNQALQLFFKSIKLFFFA